MTPTSPYDAVVVAGGAARRMGGRDKTKLKLGGQTLLDRAIAAATGAARIVVVGAERPTLQAVTWCREQPPGGGPSAAVAAGLARVSAPWVVLLAADLPFVDDRLVEALLHRLWRDCSRPGEVDGCVAVDREEQPQWLVSAWRTERLRDARWVAGGSLREAMVALQWSALPVPDDVIVLDCDTPADLARARELAP